MLMDKLESDSTLHPLAANISKSVQRGATLTRQLLAFSRQRVFQPQVIDINAHFKGFGGLLRRVIGEGVGFSVNARNADLRVVSTGTAHAKFFPCLGIPDSDPH